MVLVLTGANVYMIQKKLRELTADFISKHGDFGIETIEAGNIEAGQLHSAVSSQPFLADRRMVIVRDLSVNKSLVVQVEQLLDSVSDTTDLIIVEAKLDKRLSLYKTLKKRTEFAEYSDLDERGVSSWIVQEVKSKGGDIKPNDAQLLIARTGTNQSSLSHELDKLLAYNANITKETIELLTESSEQSTVFDLIDATFAGNKQKALLLYASQRKQQVEPQAIMGMIVWQLTTLAIVKFNFDLGQSAIASEFKMSPYTVSKNLGLASRLSVNQVKSMVNRALKLDVRLKYESIDADDAVQHFLLTV